MAGIFHLSDGAEAQPRQVFGILYAEDFDEVAGPAPQMQDPPPSEPLITSEDVEAACEQAVAAARLEWETDEARLRQQSLQLIASLITEKTEAAETIALDAAEALAQTILTTLASTLPHFCEDHGPQEVKALVARLLPLLRSEPRVVVRVHSDLVRVLQNEFENSEHALEQSISFRSGGAALGDVKVSWDCGSVVRDTKVIIQAIRDAFGQLGLQVPQEHSVKRKLVHAE